MLDPRQPGDLERGAVTTPQNWPGDRTHPAAPLFQRQTRGNVRSPSQASSAKGIASAGRLSEHSRTAHTSCQPEVTPCNSGTGRVGWYSFPGPFSFSMIALDKDSAHDARARVSLSPRARAEQACNPGSARFRPADCNHLDSCASFPDGGDYDRAEQRHGSRILSFSARQVRVRISAESDASRSLGERLPGQQKHGDICPMWCTRSQQFGLAG